MRSALKTVLGALRSRKSASGMTMLIYHRIGGGTSDELDLPTEAFTQQIALLAKHEVLSLDEAIDRLEADDPRPSIVITFDDGFADVYENAWPVLEAHRIPFTIYLASAYMGALMRWEGSTATGDAGTGLEWRQIQEMVESGLCTIGNHTHNHVPPSSLSAAELDECSTTITRELGLQPNHFTYPWGIAIPDARPLLQQRFRSASTGALGRNLPGTDLMNLARVPVRRTDPINFFAAKLTGRLFPERIYSRIVSMAKRAGIKG